MLNSGGLYANAFESAAGGEGYVHQTPFLGGRSQSCHKVAAPAPTVRVRKMANFWILILNFKKFYNLSFAFFVLVYLHKALKKKVFEVVEQQILLILSFLKLPFGAGATERRRLQKMGFRRLLFTPDMALLRSRH